jgi:hypothetical protein
VSDPVILPPLPVYPPAGSLTSAYDKFRGEMDLYRAQVALLQVEADQALATAMSASVAQQKAVADVLANPPVQPARKPTRAELVWDMVKVQPQASAFTPAFIVDGAVKIVDAYIAKCPTAVEG